MQENKEINKILEKLSDNRKESMLKSLKDKCNINSNTATSINNDITLVQLLTLTAES